MKAEVLDRRVGKTHYRRLQKCCSFTFFKKYVLLAAYLSITFAIIVFWYCYIYIQNVGRIQRSNTKDAIYREKERTPYDELLHLILHPQTHCEKSVVLGGKVGKNKKLDGDKVVCIDTVPGFGKECIVYSFGINNEWSFDEGMHKQFGCTVYAFDPSMGMEDHLHSEGVWFYNIGIANFNGKYNVHGRPWEMRTMDFILEQLGHRDKTIDFLKMDIEGAECAVLDYILDNGLLNHVNHLCIEIHLMQNPYWTRVLTLFKRIEAEAGLKHFSTRNNTQMPLMLVPGIAGRYEQHYFEMAWYRH